MKHAQFLPAHAIMVLVLLALAAPLDAQGAVTAERAAALLRQAEENTAFTDTDFYGNYALVQDKPGQGKSYLNAIMYRRDSASSYTILITGPSPSDKGKGYVQFDQNIWFYDPADRQFVFTSSHDKFQGTNANNSDFTPQHYARDYAIEKAEGVMLGKMACVLFTLRAKVDDVDYPRLKLWVTEADGLVRKKEDYSLSGQLLRTTAIPSYQKYSGHSVPDKMLFVDNLRGKRINGKMQYEKTQITITNVSFKKQSDAIYTKKYVEMMSQ